MPEKPYKPNQLAIIILGFVLASGLGVGFAALQESLDTSIKTEKELNKLVGIPVLTVISKVETRKEKSRRMFRRLVLVGAFLGFMLITAKIVNDYFMPLNEFWSVIVNNAKNM